MELPASTWNMLCSCTHLGVVVMVFFALLSSLQEVDAEALGQWRLITPNSGISAMHAAVTPVVGTVVLLHHTNSGPSNITFPDGRCRNTTYDRILKSDCFAHSVVLDPSNGTVRPMMLMTDTQCSSGQFLADGSLSQTGGDKEGRKKTRTLSASCYGVYPTSEICDWVETKKDLLDQRWYATNQLLPDGRQIVVGGRQTTTYEYAPPTSKTGLVQLALLAQTNDGYKFGPNNLYPYVHLLPNGFLYIFANRDSIIYDYKTDTVVRTFDKIPGNPRNYPSGGSSVMLPLKYNDNFRKAEILVCGGAVNGSAGNSGAQLTCSMTCGRIDVTRANSTWAMEDMPMPRCMGDMILLPDTNVLVINGAQKGFQGWLDSSVPTYNPLLYEPHKLYGSRFSVLDATTIPRVYHSTANLLPDASVMVAGSNTHEYYKFKTSKNVRDFPTELSVESFAPPYAQHIAGGRPVIMSSNTTAVKYKQAIEIQFWDPVTSSTSPDSPPPDDTFIFTMNSSPWSTHSFSHGQRLVTLKSLGFTSQIVREEEGVQVNERTVALQIPSYSTVLPATYYMLWVVKNGNPSRSCIWIQIRR